MVVFLYSVMLYEKVRLLALSGSPGITSNYKAKGLVLFNFLYHCIVFCSIVVVFWLKGCAISLNCSRGGVVICFENLISTTPRIEICFITAVGFIGTI